MRRPPHCITLHIVKNKVGLVTQESCQLWPRGAESLMALCGVSPASSPSVFLSPPLGESGWGTDNYWEPVVHLLPQGREAEVMKQLLVGMLNERRARARTHTQCMPKQLCMRLVMQRSGGLLNFTANQDASAVSSGPSALLVLCRGSLDFLIWFSFAQSPHNEKVCFHRPLREEKRKQQIGSAAWSKQHLGLLHSRTSRWVVGGSYH